MIDPDEALKPTTAQSLILEFIEILEAQISSNITVTDMYLYRIWENRAHQAYWQRVGAGSMRHASTHNRRFVVLRERISPAV